MSCDVCGSQIVIDDDAMSVTIVGDDDQIIVDGVGYELVVCDDDIGLIELDGGIVVFEEDAQIEIISFDEPIELIECCETIVSSGGGGSQVSLLDTYELSDTDTVNDITYKYFGKQDASGQWVIIRRTRAKPMLQRYAAGTTGYDAAWAARTSQTYQEYNLVF